MNDEGNNNNSCPDEDVFFDDQVNVPIRSDSRSFEEQQRDSLKRTDYLSRPGGAGGGSGDQGGTLWPNTEDWCDELSQKMEQRRKKWDDEIQKKRDDFFQLKPMNKGFGDFSKLGPGGIPENFSFEQMQSVYERRPDGKLHFRINFDVHHFAPENLKVTIDSGKLIVTAREEKKVGNTTSSREFSRSIDLPESAVQSQVTCSLSKDGVLRFDAPIKTNKTASLNRSQLNMGGSKLKTASLRAPPRSISSNTCFGSGGVGSSSSIYSDSTTCYPIVSKPSGEKWLRLEVDLGGDYTSEEIRIRTLSQKIYINARHEERTVSKTSFKEFSKEYDIPADVDPYTVTAKLDSGILVVEAPLKPKVK